ncbi:MAG: thiamine pyrophosphate-binding protein, partial [Massilia sp.]|nr:thiamine pyrophosphate-binding protein [Massilia sp.]
QCVGAMRERIPDAIICNGEGNFSSWWHRYWHYAAQPSQLAPTAGAMGYGVPAAVAAKLRAPDRPVVALAGDGDFMMNGQELATAVQYKAGVVIIVFNNSMFGTIRMHQEKNYPARVSGTALHNPDFADLALAYGASGEVVEHTAEFGPALARALEHTRSTSLPALIELRYDGNLITPGATLEAIRAAAQKARLQDDCHPALAPGRAMCS